MRAPFGPRGFPSASLCSVSSFCHLMTSIGLTLHMRMSPPLRLLNWPSHTAASPRRRSDQRAVRRVRGLESLAVAALRISQSTQPNQDTRLGGDRRLLLRQLSFCSPLHAKAFPAYMGGEMAKSQVKGSKKAKKKPPSQRGNGGAIFVFTHRRRWRLCHDSRAKRNSAAQSGTQKCRSEPYQPTPTRWL